MRKALALVLALAIFTYVAVAQTTAVASTEQKSIQPPAQQQTAQTSNFTSVKGLSSKTNTH